MPMMSKKKRKAASKTNAPRTSPIIEIHPLVLNPDILLENVGAEANMISMLAHESPLYCEGVTMLLHLVVSPTRHKSFCAYAAAAEWLSCVPSPRCPRKLLFLPVCSS